MMDEVGQKKVIQVRIPILLGGKTAKKDKSIKALHFNHCEQTVEEFYVKN